MILVIGSEGSGKLEFVKGLGYSLSQIADGTMDGSPAINHLEKIVFENPGCVDTILPELLSKEVVICNETGCGVIPAEKNARTGRETTGRLCILLARDAVSVVRMVCGMPQIIKGSMPAHRR